MLSRTRCSHCLYPLMVHRASGKPYWFCPHCSQTMPQHDESLDPEDVSSAMAQCDRTQTQIAELMQQRHHALQQELDKLNQLKDDFLSTTSHELRTPLSNMKLAIQMLDLLLRQSGLLSAAPPNTDNTSARIFDYLNVLSTECEQEISLVNDLLTLQQIEAGTQIVLPMQLPLHDWISHLLTPFEAKFFSRQQQIHVSIPPELPRLTTDFTLLGQLLSELVSNACKFTPIGGSITIAATALAGRIQIQVINSGVEIPASEWPRLFDKFYRIPTDNPWQHSGTGLGLALVKALATYLGGAIAVESQTGQTCFTLELPCAESQAVTANDMLMSYVAYYLSRGKTVMSPRQGALPFSGEVYQYCGYHRDFLEFWHQLLGRLDFAELHLQADSHAFRQFLGGGFTVTECARCRLPIATAEGYIPSTPRCELCPDPRTLGESAPLGQSTQTHVLVVGAPAQSDDPMHNTLALNGFETTVVQTLEDISSANLPPRVDLILINAERSEAEVMEWAKTLACHPALKDVQIVALSAHNGFSLPWATRTLEVEDYLLSPLGGDRLVQHLERTSDDQPPTRAFPLHWFPK